MVHTMVSLESYTCMAQTMVSLESYTCMIRLWSTWNHTLSIMADYDQPGFVGHFNIYFIKYMVQRQSTLRAKGIEVQKGHTYENF